MSKDTCSHQCMQLHGDKITYYWIKLYCTVLYWLTSHTCWLASHVKRQFLPLVTSSAIWRIMGEKVPLTIFFSFWLGQNFTWHLYKTKRPLTAFKQWYVSLWFLGSIFSYTQPLVKNVIFGEKIRTEWVKFLNTCLLSSHFWLN